jgi:hypothetical protein
MVVRHRRRATPARMDDRPTCRQQIPIVICPFAGEPDAAGGSVGEKFSARRSLRGVMIFLVLFLSRKKEQTNVLKRKLRSEGSRVYHLIGRSLMPRSASTLLILLETQPKECEALLGVSTQNHPIAIGFTQSCPARRLAYAQGYPQEGLAIYFSARFSRWSLMAVLKPFNLTSIIFQFFFSGSDAQSLSGRLFDITDHLRVNVE